MKNNKIALFVLSIGVLLLCISIVLAIVETGNKDIIGGADFSTFLFVFKYEKDGLFSKLALLGVADIIVAIAWELVKRKR
ncbi:MAG: hypothetical protein IJY39_00235 [Clostridia bacterium]|nr:hypothetical protein [Clostridia bacterium]